MLMLKVFLACLALHFFSDFTLQGLLAQLKCQDWWKKNYPEPLYQNDWLCGLIEHSLYWALVTFAPLIWLWDDSSWVLVIVLLINVGVHAYIDHLKANRRVLSLTQDQLLHFAQVVGTVIVLG